MDMLKCLGKLKCLGMYRVNNSVRLLGETFVGNESDLCFFSKFGSENRRHYIFKQKMEIYL